MPKRPVRRTTAAPADSTPREPGERLAKLLAAAGVASRRECETLVTEGRVTVDGVVETDLARRVDPYKNDVAFDGETLPKRKRVYFALNKPDGVVCTARDPSGRTRVIDLLPPDVGRVFNVGRLDMASEGLILLTNDGELANKLTHPRHGVQKVYHVKVAGVPSVETLAQLRRGVYLAEGQAHFVDAKVKSTKKSGAVLEVVLDEGRNREIRRVLARVGHKVQRLTRVAVGPVRLAELPSGAYRPLTADEVKALERAASGERPAGSDAKESRSASDAPARKPFRRGAQRSTSNASSPAQTSLGDKPRTPKKPGGYAPKTRPRAGGKPSFPRKPDGAAPPAAPQRTILGEVDPAPAESKPPRRRPMRKPAAPRVGQTSEAAPSPGRPPRKPGAFAKRSGKPGAGKPSGTGRPKGAKPKGRPKKRGAS
jgi:23S rRNA pseudouridine2605 synthase